jgi:hypothetical protein
MPCFIIHPASHEVQTQRLGRMYDRHWHTPATLGMGDPAAPDAAFSSMIRLGEASPPTRADVMAVVLAAAAAGTFSSLKALDYQGDKTEYNQHVLRLQQWCCLRITRLGLTHGRGHQADFSVHEGNDLR